MELLINTLLDKLSKAAYISKVPQKMSTKPEHLITKPESLSPHYSDHPNYGKFKALLRHPEIGHQLYGKIGYNKKQNTIETVHPEAHNIISQHIAKLKGAP